jgi:hypothetical protein
MAGILPDGFTDFRYKERNHVSMSLDHMRPSYKLLTSKLPQDAHPKI